MKKILGFFLFFVFISADAALIGRLPVTPGGTDYQAYYDTDLGITWAANANLLPSPSGTNNWGDSNDWVASLDIGGVMGWRLPTTTYADTTCSNPGGASMGTGCTGSEMGYLFNVEGISAASPGPFSGIQDSSLGYWSATPFLSNSAWIFDFGTGIQSSGPANSPWRYAWAVQTGDVGVVPIPAAVWLFGSGLLGLLGLSRRKR